MGNASTNRSRPGRWTVHPHVHGERVGMIKWFPSSDGSSPRAWGTPSRRPRETGKARFIPTCMGNASGCHSVRWLPSVHPHVHGERSLSLFALSLPLGSSPRAWGTLAGGRSVRGGVRFIPTCMGNATVTQSDNVYFTVHPHVHGERNFRLAGDVIKYGSSPRAWGTLLWVL